MRAIMIQILDSNKNKNKSIFFLNPSTVQFLSGWIVQIEDEALLKKVED